MTEPEQDVLLGVISDEDETAEHYDGWDDDDFEWRLECRSDD